MKTLTIEVMHNQHHVILTDENGRRLNVSYARTEKGAKMCFSRYARENGFTKSADGKIATK